MKSLFQFVATTAAVLAAGTGTAWASPRFLTVPEPGTIALLAVGVAGALWFGRGRK